VRQLGGGVSAPTSSIRYRALVLLDGYCGLRPRAGWPPARPHRPAPLCSGR